VNTIKQKMEKYGTDDFSRWTSEILQSEEHLTLLEMQKLLVELVGTKQSLPFIQEFEENLITTVAKIDLNEALELQKKAKERYLIL
jgi:hypothetical protein